MVKAKISRAFGQRRQQGFTLVELVVVMIIIGFLAVIVSRQFTGGITDAAGGRALVRTGDRLEEGWRTFTAIAGISLNPDASANPALEDDALAMLVKDGEDAVTSRYQASYRKASMSLVDSIEERNGKYYYNDYEVQMSSSGRIVTISFHDVPGRIAEAVAMEMVGTDDLEDIDSSRIEIAPEGGEDSYQINLNYS